jgi:acyl-lipid omega-6 desaturase (Delta-12 desaturase)
MSTPNRRAQMNPQPSLFAQTKKFARDHRGRSWWHILSTGTLLAATTAGTLPGLPLAVRIVCSLISGLLLVRFFVIYHDHQHHAILPKSRLADLGMRLFGHYILCPSTIWRSSHNYHHTHNCKLRSAHIGSFPVMTREQFRKSSASDRALYLFMRHPLTIFFGYLTVFLFGMTILPFLNDPRRHLDSLFALLLHLALATAVVLGFGWSTLFLLLIVPRWLSGAMGAYLFYAQHNFPSVMLRDKEGWTYEGAALESSSYLRTGAVLAWFTGNIGYHHIHHLNHRIPFYRLPEVYRAIPELRAAKTTTLHPAEILRCLRLKVWCVDRQQMVDLNGV